MYRAYYHAMMLLCMRYTKNEQDALEALNTGFFKVFKNIEHYDSSRSGLYTWIRAIIVNSCIDILRLKEKQPDHKELEKAAEVYIDPDVINKMEIKQLLEIIRKLPPASRAVFNLYVIEGYHHKEIGELLNISEGTSKWHLSEARKALQHLIRQQEVAI